MMDGAIMKPSLHLAHAKLGEAAQQSKAALQNTRSIRARAQRVHDGKFPSRRP